VDKELKLRILGTHNYESRDTRYVSFLIDDILALDAGSITRALTFSEQEKIRAILLSHGHFDHIRDIDSLALPSKNAELTINVIGISETIQSVKSTLPKIYLEPNPLLPTYILEEKNPYETFSVLNYGVTILPVNHSIPASGFQISDEKIKLFYTGDTGSQLSHLWNHISPNVLLTEVTFGNENIDKARSVGHLTPFLLGEVLEEFESVHGYFPRVITTHFNPSWERTIRQELQQLSEKLGIEIIISIADQIIDL